MTHYPPPEAGLSVVRPQAAHPARKIRVLTDLLIERICMHHALGIPVGKG